MNYIISFFIPYTFQNWVFKFLTPFFSHANVSRPENRHDLLPTSLHLCFRSILKFSKISIFVIFGGLDPRFLHFSFFLEDFSFRVQACWHICTREKICLTKKHGQTYFKTLRFNKKLALSKTRTALNQFSKHNDLKWTWMLKKKDKNAKLKEIKQNRTEKNETTTLRMKKTANSRSNNRKKRQ